MILLYYLLYLSSSLFELDLSFVLAQVEPKLVLICDKIYRIGIYVVIIIMIVRKVKRSIRKLKLIRTRTPVLVTPVEFCLEKLILLGREVKRIRRRLRTRIPKKILVAVTPYCSFEVIFAFMWSILVIVICSGPFLYLILNYFFLPHLISFFNIIKLVLDYLTKDNELSEEILFTGELVEPEMEFIGFFIYLFVLLMVFIIIAIILYLLYAPRIYQYKESLYECGFKPFSKRAFYPYDIQFYRIGILFLLFDIEIITLFPWAIAYYEYTLFCHIAVLLVVLFLLFGWLCEVKLGTLTWYPLKYKKVNSFQ